MGRFARIIGGILDVVLPPRDAARLVRACDPKSFGALLSARSDERGIVSLLPYRHPLVRAAVLEAKFRDNARAQELLASVLIDYLAALGDEYALEPARLVVVPIPLSRARMRERGYNQVVRVLERERIPYIGALERVRDTKPQTTLKRRERLANMEGAFRCILPLDTEAHYLLLDDVATTGATLKAARAALAEAGARCIVPLALAH